MKVTKKLAVLIPILLGVPLNTLLGQRSPLVDTNTGIFIFMQEFATTSAKDDPILKTIGIGPCIVVSFFDKRSKTGSMVHLTPMTEVGTLAQTFRKMTDSMKLAGYNNQETNGLQIRIVGGQKPESDLLFMRIRNLLSSLKFPDPVEVDYGDEESESVALDTRTGNLFDLIKIKPYIRSGNREQETLEKIREAKALLPFVSYTIDEKAKKYKVFIPAFAY